MTALQNWIVIVLLVILLVQIAFVISQIGTLERIERKQMEDIGRLREIIGQYTSSPAVEQGRREAALFYLFSGLFRQLGQLGNVHRALSRLNFVHGGQVQH